MFNLGHCPHLDRFFQEHPFIHLSSFGGAALGRVAALAMFDQVADPRPSTLQLSPC